MESFFEIYFEVESFTKKHFEGNKISLWDRLLESSIKSNGSGCDGILMWEVEKYTEKLLSIIEEKEMQVIWGETENGIMSIEQGFNEVDRIDMIHDISLDVNQEIVDNICQEAKKTIKRKNRKIK